jgi:hypothetical protein
MLLPLTFTNDSIHNTRRRLPNPPALSKPETQSKNLDKGNIPSLGSAKLHLIQYASTDSTIQPEVYGVVKAGLDALRYHSEAADDVMSRMTEPNLRSSLFGLRIDGKAPRSVVKTRTAIGQILAGTTAMDRD